MRRSVKNGKHVHDVGLASAVHLRRLNATEKFCYGHAEALGQCAKVRSFKSLMARFEPLIAVDRNSNQHRSIIHRNSSSVSYRPNASANLSIYEIPRFSHSDALLPNRADRYYSLSVLSKRNATTHTVVSA